MLFQGLSICDFLLFRCLRKNCVPLAKLHTGYEVCRVVRYLEALGLLLTKIESLSKYLQFQIFQIIVF